MVVFVTVVVVVNVLDSTGGPEPAVIVVGVVVGAVVVAIVVAVMAVVVIVCHMDVSRCLPPRVW